VTISSTTCDHPPGGVSARYTCACVRGTRIGGGACDAYVGTHPRDQIRRNIVPAFIELEQAREGGECVRQRVPARVQCQVSQLPETALGNEDFGERGVADVRLQLENCHLLDGIL